MEEINIHIQETCKACGDAQKKWSDHMKKEDYCLNTNYILYKRYIKIFNHLKMLNELLEVKNPQE